MSAPTVLLCTALRCGGGIVTVARSRRTVELVSVSENRAAFVSVELEPHEASYLASMLEGAAELARLEVGP